MKIGLIARCEVARGLAIQTKNFYDHIPVDKVLVIRMPRPDCAEQPDWYPNAVNVNYDSLLHQLPEPIIRQWLEGLDVVFTAETPYDWRLLAWAAEAGVKTVIQGNPEFYRHHLPQFSNLAQPDEWWWPTTWRLDHLPHGKVMPVPMPDNVQRTAAHAHDIHPLQVVHVIGKRAFGDRNSSDLFCDALRATRADMHVTMHGIDGQLPEILRQPNLSKTLHADPVENRFAMYAGQHVLVIPRRYGGLCLPALEAAASGVAVMMSDQSPNQELASVLIPVHHHMSIGLACGSVRYGEVDHMVIGMMMDDLARNRDLVAEAQQQSVTMVPRWSQWRDKYMKELAA